MSAEVTQIISTLQTVEVVEEQSFYIPMTGPAARPRRSLKHDDTFVVLDSHGDIGASAGGPDGLFNGDTRYLARLELVLDELQPLLLGSNLRDDNSSLTVDLTNPDIYHQGRIVLQKDMLHIVRTIFLWRGTAYQRIGLQNHGDRRASFDLTLLFDSDFADLFEVRGEKRPRRGVGSGRLLSPADLMLEYRGLDGLSRTTSLHFDPRPTRLAMNAATYPLDLAPQEISSLFVAVSCNKRPEEKPVRFFTGLLAHRREMRRSTAGTTSIETSSDIFNEVLCRSMADLNILMTETPQGRYPYAGIPWYSTTFGRDGIITALQMLWIDPRIACGVLKRLAFYQAKAVDPLADAQPGKILHEMRGGEMAALREVPFAQYYGSVDATPLFVLLAGLYVERTGDEETLAELWPAIEAALRWIDGAGDPDKDGFVEYRAEAQRLAERFEGAFWCEELGTYALALDGDKQPCKVRSSNAGHLLFSGIVREDRAQKVAADLMRPHFFTGWGIRTVALGEARYNPMSYHDGSIWPHDNALISLGFARYGLKHSVEQVFKGLFDAATYMDLRRLPELFCGFRREKHRGPTLYPVACVARCEIRLRNPRLPAFLDEVILRQLQLGPSTVDLRITRHGDDVSLEVLRRRGKIQVSIVLAH